MFYSKTKMKEKQAMDTQRILALSKKLYNLLLHFVLRYKQFFVCVFKYSYA